LLHCVWGTYIHTADRNIKIRTAFFAPAAVLTLEVLFLVPNWYPHIMFPPPAVLQWHHTADYLASFLTLQTAAGILEVQFHTFLYVTHIMEM
jgi:hypothetical protein